MHGAFYLVIVLPVYVLANYLVTLHALKYPYVHDLVALSSPYAKTAINITMIISIIFSLLSKPDLDLLCKRLALVYAIKCVAQTITVVPQPNGMQECAGIQWYELRSCTDMMPSGHTMFVYLILYKTKLRFVLAVFMAFELVLADWHYASDVFMAFLIACYSEKVIQTTLADPIDGAWQVDYCTTRSETTTAVDCTRRRNTPVNTTERYDSDAEGLH